MRARACISATTISSSTEWRLVALGINASGQAVGWFQPGSGGQDASLWQNGVLTDLGTGWALAVNASGQVISNSNEGAFLWQNELLHIARLPEPRNRLEAEADYRARRWTKPTATAQWKYTARCRGWQPGRVGSASAGCPESYVRAASLLRE